MGVEESRYWVVTDGLNESLTNDPRHVEAADESREAREDEITSESVADMLDDIAEGWNHHAFVGVHSRLAAIVRRRFGEETAARVMRDVADHGGLPALKAAYMPGLDDEQEAGDA